MQSYTTAIGFALAILFFCIGASFVCVDIYLLSVGGIPDSCMRLISIWMICDAVVRMSNLFGGNSGQAIAMYIWNIVNLIILDCDEIYEPYYNYALTVVIYDSACICAGIIILCMYVPYVLITLDTIRTRYDRSDYEKIYCEDD